jgi:nucleotide-binding universal stress UspA family protein
MTEFAPKRILCPVDFSLVSPDVLAWAGLFGSKFGAHLDILHSSWIEPPVYFTSAQTDELAASLKAQHRLVEQRLRELAEEVLEPGVSLDVISIEGHATQAIQAQMEERRPDLVVMGSHGRSGVARFLLGSVAENIIRSATSPILVVRSRPGSERKLQLSKILCPVNFTEAARHSLDLCSGMASAFSAHLDVVHAVESPGEDLEASRRRLCSWIPGEVRSTCEVSEVVRQGDAAEQVIRLAREARSDLIVLGAQHRPFLEYTTLGTTTIRVMRHSDTSVLIVPHATG